MPTLTFKVSPAEARVIRAAAHAAKANVSTFLRERALGAAKRPQPRKLVFKRHPVSGLPYDASGKNLPIVTREQIAAALADFP